MFPGHVRADGLVGLLGELVQVSEVHGLVDSGHFELLHLLQEEVHGGEGGVHASVEHALQEGLVRGSLELLQLHRLRGGVLADVGIPEGLCEVPHGLRGVQGEYRAWQLLKSSWGCDRSIGLVASDSVGGLGVELEHHVPAGAALRSGVRAPLQGAGKRAWWRHG